MKAYCDNLMLKVTIKNTPKSVFLAAMLGLSVEVNFDYSLIVQDVLYNLHWPT